MTYFAELWIALKILDGVSGADALALDLRPRIEKACADVKKNSAAGLQLEWGGDAGAGALRRLSSDSDGKQFYIAWLKDRYGYNVARVNQAYALESTSFSDLAESSFEKLDLTRVAVREDDAAFLVYLEATLKQRIDEMFQACAAGRKTEWKRNRT